MIINYSIDRNINTRQYIYIYRTDDALLRYIGTYSITHLHINLFAVPRLCVTITNIDTRMRYRF